MKFWWFKFEGWFADDSTEFPGEGVYSQCMVRAAFDQAEFEFLTGLTARKINLVEIEDHHLVDVNPAERDYENSDNRYWLDWCEETELEGKPTFESLHLYPADEVERLAPEGN